MSEDNEITSSLTPNVDNFTDIFHKLFDYVNYSCENLFHNSADDYSPAVVGVCSICGGVLMAVAASHTCGSCSVCSACLTHAANSCSFNPVVHLAASQHDSLIAMSGSMVSTSTSSSIVPPSCCGLCPTPVINQINTTATPNCCWVFQIGPVTTTPNPGCCNLPIFCQPIQPSPPYANCSNCPSCQGCCGNYCLPMCGCNTCSECPICPFTCGNCCPITTYYFSMAQCINYCAVIVTATGTVIYAYFNYNNTENFIEIVENTNIPTYEPIPTTYIPDTSREKKPVKIITSETNILSKPEPRGFSKNSDKKRPNTSNVAPEYYSLYASCPERSQEEDIYYTSPWGLVVQDDHLIGLTGETFQYMYFKLDQNKTVQSSMDQVQSSTIAQLNPNPDKSSQFNIPENEFGPPSHPSFQDMIHRFQTLNHAANNLHHNYGGIDRTSKFDQSTPTKRISLKPQSIVNTINPSISSNDTSSRRSSFTNPSINPSIVTNESSSRRSSISEISVRNKLNSATLAVNAFKANSSISHQNGSDNSASNTLTNSAFTPVSLPADSISSHISQAPNNTRKTNTFKAIAATVSKLESYSNQQVGENNPLNDTIAKRKMSILKYKNPDSITSHETSDYHQDSISSLERSINKDESTPVPSKSITFASNTEDMSLPKSIGNSPNAIPVSISPALPAPPPPPPLSQLAIKSEPIDSTKSSGVSSSSSGFAFPLRPLTPVTLADQNINPFLERSNNEL